MAGGEGEGIVNKMSKFKAQMTNQIQNPNIKKSLLTFGFLHLKLLRISIRN